MTTTTKFKALSGHKATYSRGGYDDSFWSAKCECGWSSSRWTARKGDVVDSHRSHVETVREGGVERIRGVMRDWSEKVAP